MSLRALLVPPHRAAIAVTFSRERGFGARKSSIATSRARSTAALIEPATCWPCADSQGDSNFAEAGHSFNVLRPQTLAVDSFLRGAIETLAEVAGAFVRGAKEEP